MHFQRNPTACSTPPADSHGGLAAPLCTAPASGDQPLRPRSAAGIEIPGHERRAATQPRPQPNAVK